MAETEDKKRTKRPSMIGKKIDFQAPNTVEDSGSGMIIDKLLSKHMTYYLVVFDNGDTRSIPCHWVCHIHNMED